jgi:CubicO group peptidase (beta-lactamase class C family)
MLRTLVLPVLILAAAPAVPVDYGPATVEVREGNLASAIDGEFRTALASGVTGDVLVEQDGKIVLKAGYGWANREKKIPFTTKTISQIGSITKQFTAMALIGLWHDGKIDFSKPVKTYLPNVAEPVASLALDQILTHRSGMPEYCGDDFDPLSKAALLSKCAATPLAFPAGAKFQYSNPGFSIIAAVVEQVSGMPIDTYLKKRFFGPLSMHDAGYEFPNVPLDRFAVGYLNDKNQGIISETMKPLHGDAWNIIGNGGIQASTDDMYRWYQALSGGTDIPKDMRDAAIAQRVPREDDIIDGYGWNMRKAPDGHTVQVSHSGSDGTFFSYFCWRPDDRTFFYMESNAGEKGATDLVKKMLVSVRDAGKMPVTKH